MVHPELHKMLDIGSESRHRGKYKNFTKNCTCCDWYTVYDNENRCYWGLTWKRLVKEEKQRKCEYYGKPSPREELYLWGIEKKKKSEDFMKRLMENISRHEENDKKPKTYMDMIGRREKI